MSIKEIPEGITPEQAAVVLARPLAAHIKRVHEYSGPDVDLGREESEQLMDYYNQSKALLKEQGFDELTQRILEQSRNYLLEDFIYQRLGTGSKPELPSIDETLRSMENPWSNLLKMVVFMDMTFTHQELRMRYGQFPP